MAHNSNAERSVNVPILARVEGEGALHLTVVDGEVTDARLRIYEPPRFFEGILVGRRYDEPIDVTSRICGICPIAYQVSAANALEAALRIEIDPAVADLRRIIYCGEWIESHLLHVVMLHAPDFLGYPNGIAMAADHRHHVETGLRLKKLGNDLVAAIGGRAIHPVNLRVGGVHRALRRNELTPLLAELAWARGAAAELLRWVASFELPSFEEPDEVVSLRRDGHYPLEGGRLVSSGGIDAAVNAWSEHLVEIQVPHSTALHSQTVDGRRYVVGPIARWNLNHDLLHPEVRELAAEVGLGPTCRNPFQSIVVWTAEALEAIIEAERLIEAYRPPSRPYVPYAVRAGVGHGASEAPRGTLYHRYELDGDGVIRAARIVPPTAQVQPVVEADLRRFATDHLHLPDDELALACERVVRNFDPCISCSTHFLRLTIDRR
jgi:coenzyme F420-reducing hydrogenase alpha subunit